MSNLQNIQDVSIPKVRASESVVATWRLVLKRELMDLWIGGKAFNLLLIYSAVLGLISYTYSFSTELSLAPPQEAVYEMLKNATAFSIFIGLIIGTDSFSGERDRSTLESLLLTPVNRRHIIIAKLLAGISTWPAAYLIALPFLYVLAQGHEVLAPAMIWGALTGTVLVLGYTGLGMLVSFWSSTNKISYFVSLSIYALLLVPVELSGDGVDITGEFLQWINPVSAINYFLSKYLLFHRPAGEYWPWLVSSVLLAVLTVILLLKFAGSRLRLEPGLRRKIRTAMRKVIGLAALFALFAVSLSASPAHAVQSDQAQDNELEISIDTKFKQVKMGEVVKFSTDISNRGVQTSSPFIVALNVVNLQERGEVVDLEEWSPQRTQYIEALAPDESVNLDWIVTTVVHGEYIVYIALIPQPRSAEDTTFPVASSSLYLMVTPSARLNPAGVLPFALGVPVVLLAITFVVYRRRRQQIDMGDPL
jgi:ABC-type transport system involved in cytochrome c biogenesis permease component